MSYENGMGPGPFYDNTPLPEYTSRPDPFHDKLIADVFQEIANPRVSQQAVDRIEAIYMKKIRQLQDQLAQTVKERNELLVKKNGYVEAIREIVQEESLDIEKVREKCKGYIAKNAAEAGVAIEE